MNNETGKQHEWLQRLAGEWTFVENDSAGAEHTGTESIQPVGSLWIQATAQFKMPDGAPGSSVMTLGFDPQKGRFVGSWIGSMMTNLWIYDGWLDETEKVLTLESEGPDFAGKGTIGKYKDIIELRSPDHRVMTSHTLGEDGQWQCFMTMHYRRIK